MPITFLVKKGAIPPEPPEETWYEATTSPYWGDPEDGQWEDGEWKESGEEGPPPS